MKYYIAPLEGVTGFVFRNAHYQFFHPADKYFSPFITPGINSTRKSKALKDVLPENNKCPNVIPQILTNKADEFNFTARQLKELGYDEINLNLGCPSGTVVGKRRGSGFLPYLNELDAFLEDIYNDAEKKTGLKISIKTRLGKDSPDEFDAILDIYNQYPLEELIIHPRTREEFYKGVPHLDAFASGLEKSKAPVSYNGNIFTKQDNKKILEQFPNVDSIMIGRGMIANPALLDQILGDTEKIDKKKLKDFHDCLYEGYREIMYGEKPHLFKMKEVWGFMIYMFADNKKFAKKIRKAQRLKDYEMIVEELFETLEIGDNPGYLAE